MKNNKGFVGIGLILVIIAILTVGGGAIYYAKKTPIPVIKNIPIKVAKDSSKEVLQDTKGYQKAKVVNLTGLDGCGFEIELENGTKIEPINLSDEFKKDKLSVLIKYKERPDINSICMVGKAVELTSLIIDNSLLRVGNNEIITIENILLNKSAYDNKLVTIQGYVYRDDIKSELMKGNQFINIRNTSDMYKNKIISMKIMSDDIKNLLINKNNSNNDWIKVEVSGILKLITLPLNGSVGQGIIIEVNTLIIN